MTQEIQKLIDDGREGVTLGNEDRLADALEVAVMALNHHAAGDWGDVARKALAEIQTIAERDKL